MQNLFHQGGSTSLAPAASRRRLGVKGYSAFQIALAKTRLHIAGGDGGADVVTVVVVVVVVLVMHAACTQKESPQMTMVVPICSTAVRCSLCSKLTILTMNGSSHVTMCIGMSMLTRPIFQHMITGQSKSSHIQNALGHCACSALLYLSSWNKDFEGGEFVFLGEGGPGGEHQVSEAIVMQQLSYF
jgi:hypothetical protein